MIRAVSPAIRAVAGSVFLSLVATLPALADGQILAVKGEVLKEGTTFVTEAVAAMDKVSAKMSVDGKITEMTGNRKDTRTTRWEGLGQGKVRRTLTEAKTEGEIVANGEKMPPPEARDSLVSVPLIGSYTDGKWTFKLEKGEANPVQQMSIGKFTESRSKESAVALYGDVPRKPGDKWEAASDFLSDEILGKFTPLDELQGKISLEFQEVKPFQGTPCAVLKVTFDLSLPKDTESAQGSANLKGSGTIYRSLADHVDLSWQLNGDFKGTPPESEGGGQVTAKFSATSKTTVTKKK